MKLHITVLRVNSKYVASNFSKGYIKKKAIVTFVTLNLAEKCLGNVWVGQDQRQQ